jgi:hypothetical protein
MSNILRQRVTSIASSSGNSAPSAASQPTSGPETGNPKRLFTPLTIWLVLFFAINCFAINAALHLMGFSSTALDCSLEFYRKDCKLADSWGSMRWAMNYIHENPGMDCYDNLFVRRPIKFQYPPTSLLWLEPLHGSGLDSDKALNKVSRNALILAALVVACIYCLSLKRYVWCDGSHAWPDKAVNSMLALCFAFTFYPWMWSYHLGQIQSWIDLFFACLVLAWITGWKGLAGVFVALICTIKPQLGLMVIWALWRRQWRFAAGWGIIFVPFLALSVFKYGFPLHEEYVKVLSFLTSHGESYCRNQSVNGILHRLIFNGKNLARRNLYFPPYNTWVHAGTVISSFFILAVAFFWRRKEHEKAETTDMMIAALSFTMAAPVVWEHHYGIVLPMFAVVLPLTLAKRNLRGWLVALVVSYFLLSNYFPFTDCLAATCFNIFQSYWFFGGLLLLVYLYLLRNTQQSVD